MKRYKSKRSSLFVTVLNYSALGMCKRTSGRALVIFMFDNDLDRVHRVMDRREFLEKYEVIS